MNSLQKRLFRIFYADRGAVGDARPRHRFVDVLAISVLIEARHSIISGVYFRHRDCKKLLLCLSILVSNLAFQMNWCKQWRSHWGHLHFPKIAIFDDKYKILLSNDFNLF